MKTLIWTKMQWMFALFVIAFVAAQAGVAAYAQHPADIGGGGYVDHGDGDGGYGGGNGDHSGVQTSLADQAFRPQALTDAALAAAFGNQNLLPDMNAVSSSLTALVPGEGNLLFGLGPTVKVTPADLDGDGVADDEDGDGNPDGQTVTTSDESSYVSETRVDKDKDGKPEIIVVESGGVIKGGNESTTVTVADSNEDGKPDSVTTTKRTETTDPDTNETTITEETSVDSDGDGDADTHKENERSITEQEGDGAGVLGSSTVGERERTDRNKDGDFNDEGEGWINLDPFTGQPY